MCNDVTQQIIIRLETKSTVLTNEHYIILINSTAR